MKKVIVILVVLLVLGGCYPIPTIPKGWIP